MTTKVVRGSLWTIGGQGVTLVASLIATPFTIRLLGTEGYGVLALVNVLFAYLAFADLGMGVVSTQFGAEAHSEGDNLREARIIWTSLLISLIPSLPVALALFFSSGFIVERVIRLPLHLRDGATVALQLVAIGLLARTASGVLNTPQLVRLRMDLVTIITTGTGLLQICLVPLVLFYNGGLKGAVAVITAMTVVAAVANLILSHRLQPLLLWPKFDLSLLRPLSSFGRSVISVSLMGIVVANTEKLLLPRLVSVSELAHYSVAYTLAGLLLTVPAALSATLIPAFSRLQTNADHSPLKQLYVTALRGNLFWVVPAAFLVCAVARPFITYWAGPEYGRESTLPAYILAAGIIFHVMAYIPICYLLALRKAHLIAICYVAELVPYIFFAVILMRKFGAVGAALAWTIRVIIDAILLSVIAKRVSDIPFSPLARNKVDWVIAVAVLVVGFLLLFLNNLSLPKTLLVIGASLVLYCWLLWRRVLMLEEQAWLSNVFRSTLRFAFGRQL
jgi:O-antigen/teichoic acid export membrane protein